MDEREGEQKCLALYGREHAELSWQKFTALMTSGELRKLLLDPTLCRAFGGRGFHLRIVSFAGWTVSDMAELPETMREQECESYRICAVPPLQIVGDLPAHLQLDGRDFKLR